MIINRDNDDDDDDDENVCICRIGLNMLLKENKELKKFPTVDMGYYMYNDVVCQMRHVRNFDLTGKLHIPFFI